MPVDTNDRGVVDVHAHVMPLDLLERLAAEGRADLSALADGRVTLAAEVSGLNEGAPIPCSPEHYDIEARIESMDRSRTVIQAVSAPPFLFGSPTDDDLALELARRSNRALAAWVAPAPDRFVALGTVPVCRPGARDEAVRCLDELGMAGVTLGTAGGARELDDPVNEELWAFLADRATFILLHPSSLSSPDRVADYHLAQLVGFPAETALAVSRLIFGGVVDRHELILCLAHGGGCVRALRGRLDLGWKRKPVAHTTPEVPSAYLRRMRYDTAVFDTTVLGQMIDDVGPDRVLVGTDSPFDLADRDPVATVAALDLAPDASAAILGDNARRLLGLGSARVPPPEPASHGRTTRA
jgi:aminocarboxymuconate-semialdehyde decarboxylase